MQPFTTLLRRFGQHGENIGLATLGWTYIAIPNSVSSALKPGQKTSFRVKGTLDAFAIKQVALVPMGEAGDTNSSFMLVVNAAMRRGIRKEVGATVQVYLEVDTEPIPLSVDLLTCLADDPAALDFFNSLPKGHQTYFSQWIEAAKTTATKAKRITQAVMGLSMKLGYGEMIRYVKKNG